MNKKLNKYDIVLIKFPYSDFSKFKIRPALVIAKIEGENNIYIPISTKKGNLEKYNIELEIEILNSKSYLKIDKIVNLNNSLFISKIGTLSKKKKNEVDEKLKKMFNLKI